MFLITCPKQIAVRSYERTRLSLFFCVLLLYTHAMTHRAAATLPPRKWTALKTHVHLSIFGIKTRTVGVLVVSPINAVCFYGSPQLAAHILRGPNNQVMWDTVRWTWEDRKKRRKRRAQLYYEKSVRERAKRLFWLFGNHRKFQKLHLLWKQDFKIFAFVLLILTMVLQWIKTKELNDVTVRLSGTFSNISWFVLIDLLLKTMRLFGASSSKTIFHHYAMKYLIWIWKI